MDNQIDTIMGQHAALAAIENSKRVIISLKCTKEFFEKNKFVIENRGISKLFIASRFENPLSTMTSNSICKLLPGIKYPIGVSEPAIKGTFFL